MTKVAMQGDSFTLSFKLTRSGVVLAPDNIAELEVTIGKKLRKTLSGSEVQYDLNSGRWRFRLTQRDTMQLDCLVHHDIRARAKYDDNPDSDVKGVLLGTLYLETGSSKEVL
jgi:hypothetical protein